MQVGQRRVHERLTQVYAAKARVTAEVLELWKRLREIEADPVARNEWEPVGRYREYSDAKKRLCTCLGLDWALMISPLDAKSASPRKYMLHNPIQVEGWRKAWEWRQVLEEAAG
jgi:hypothetical protein